MRIFYLFLLLFLNLNAQKRILLVDNGCKFFTYIQQSIVEKGIETFIVKSSDTFCVTDLLRDVAGIVLSGGPARLSQPLDIKRIQLNIALLMHADVPVLGICLGHQILSMVLGGHLISLPNRVKKEERIRVVYNDALFMSLPLQFYMHESHCDGVVSLPHNCILLAQSPTCPVEAIRHRDKPIYGVQFHPEVSGEYGKQILKNFLHMCGLA